MDRPIVIAPGLSVPPGELEVEYSRSSGPGGQHVNKTETRVTLRFNLAASPSIPDLDRARMLARLGSRLTKNGELLVSAGRHRDRSQNLSAAFERLEALLQAAYERPRVRKATKTPKRAHARRIDDKRRTAARKTSRQRPGGDD